MEKYKGFGESHMTIDEVRRFVRFGDPGVWVCYFIGSALPYRPGAVWEVVYELSKAGYLILAQRRIEHGVAPEIVCGRFEYMACRTNKPWAEPERAAKTKAMMRA